MRANLLTVSICERRQTVAWPDGKFSAMACPLGGKHWPVAATLVYSRRQRWARKVHLHVAQVLHHQAIKVAGVIGVICTTQRGLPMSLVLLIAVQASATEFHSVESIRTAAEQHARQRLPHVDRVEAVSVDSRLRLKRCNEPLQAHSDATNTRAGMTVEVSCTGPHPWKLYVPVRASTAMPVVVAVKGLGANQVLSLQDVRLESRTTSSLPYGFFTDPGEVIGARMRRTVASGTVLVPAALKVDKLVRRGQRVTLIRDASGIMVKGSGVALTDGVKAQRIQVRTPSSRIVEGTVISADIVRIGS